MSIPWSQEQAALDSAAECTPINAWKRKKTCTAVHDAISHFVNIHFVVTEECGALKIHFERRKSHKIRSGMQRFALTHILFPGGAALGCRREMSSLAGVDRVCAGIMRGRKKKAPESSTSAAHDS